MLRVHSADGADGGEIPAAGLSTSRRVGTETMRVLHLLPAQIAESPHGDGGLGFYVQLREDETTSGCSGSSCATLSHWGEPFVAAQWVGRRFLWSQALEVEYRNEDLPSGCRGSHAIHVSRNDGHPPVLYAPCWSLRVLAAWALNAVLLWGSSGLLLYAIRVRAMLPSALQVSSLDDDEWRRDFVLALLINTLLSLVVVDMVKVACLTLTSQAAMQSFGLVAPGQTKLVGSQKVIVRSMRRAHMLLDWLL